MTTKKTLLISLLILAGGAIVTVIIFNTEPTAQRGGATKKTAMLVDVTEVHRDTFQPVIEATGTVQPARDITLSPRVSGQIIDRSPQFVPGGFVEKGTTLAQIDPADYQNDLEQSKGTLRQALADLNIERGRQDVAQKDYELVGDTLIDNLTDQNKDLVLRQPQLESAKANVEAARAAMNQAKLNLERTSIEAPFDAHVINRNANIGSQVAPGDNLGRLVGLDEYWVVTTIPLSKLSRLSFAQEQGKQGTRVTIMDRNSWQEGRSRTGRLYKRIAALEGDTRLARVLVSVEDPLAYRTDSAQLPSLMIGAFVEAHIRGEAIPDVVRLNRDQLRKNETAWVMKDGKLRIRDLDIVFKDAKYAYVRSGLEDGDQVVTTNLTTVVDGSPLRTEVADTTQQ